MPKAVLDVTVKDQDGKVVFTNQKEFTVNDLYFEEGKQIALAELDMNALEHIDLGLKALETITNTFIIPLKVETKSVDVEASFRYFYSRDKTFTVKKVVQKVVIE